MKQADSEYHSTIHTKFLEQDPQRLFLHQRVALFPRIIRSIPSIRSARILDIGAGTGYAGIYLAKRFPNVSVVALEESSVAAEQLIPRMASTHGVADRVTVAYGSFSPTRICLT